MLVPGGVAYGPLVAVQGYSGYVPGKGPDNIHGGSWHHMTAIGADIRSHAGPRVGDEMWPGTDVRLSRAAIKHRHMHKPGPAAPAIPGYTGHVPGKEGNAVYGGTFTVDNAVSALCSAHPAYCNQKLGHDFWTNKRGAIGQLSEALVHQPVRVDLMPLNPPLDRISVSMDPPRAPQNRGSELNVMMKEKWGKMDEVRMARRMQSTESEPCLTPHLPSPKRRMLSVSDFPKGKGRKVQPSMCDNRQFSYQPPPSPGGRKDPFEVSLTQGTAGVCSYSTKLDPLRQRAGYGKMIRVGGGRI